MLLPGLVIMHIASFCQTGKTFALQIEAGLSVALCLQQLTIPIVVIGLQQLWSTVKLNSQAY